MPTCPSRSTSASARHGTAPGSTPSNCTTDRALPSSSKYGILRAEVLETMLCGCATWSPGACHFWRLYAGGGSGSRDSGAHKGYETAAVRYVRRTSGGLGKRVDGVSPGRPQELSASTPTIGQLQPRTRGNGAGRRNISWRNGPLQRKPGLNYGIQSHARTRREGPRRGREQAGLCWFARHIWLATRGANVYPSGVWFADAMSSFSRVTRLLCFVFIFMVSLKPGPFVQSFFDTQAPRQLNVLPLPFYLFGRVRRTFSPFRMVLFLPCDHGLDFFFSLAYVRIQ